MTEVLERPWYMSAILTICGWIGAFLLLFAIGLAFEALGLFEKGLGPILIGASALGPLFWAEQRLSNMFLQETITPLMLGACLSIIFGAHTLWDINAAALCCWILLAVFSVSKRKAALAFTLTITAWFFTFAALGESTSSIVEEGLISALLIAAVIASLFPNRYIRAIDHGLPTLLALIFVLSFDVFDFRMTAHGALLKGPAVALFIATLWLLHGKKLSIKFAAISFSSVIAFAAFPLAIIPASTVILLGWIRGDRAFAVIGLLLTTAVLFQYYTGLDLSLLRRSLHFSVIGTALLFIYWVMKR